MLVMLVSACVSRGFTLLVVRWYGGTGDSGLWHPVETCGNDIKLSRLRDYYAYTL